MDLLHQSIHKALQTVKAGGIILYPTDTVWGLGCDATDAKAIDRIYKLKQRDDSKSLIILVADAKAILKYVAAPPPAIFDLLQNSERPTTVIYDQALGLPDNLVNEDGSIAIRIVNEPFCKALIKRLGKPIVSTSANSSGQPAPKNYSETTPVIREGVDYIVEYRKKDTRPAIPSKIIRLSQKGEIQIIRA